MRAVAPLERLFERCLVLEVGVEGDDLCRRHDRALSRTSAVRFDCVRMTIPFARPTDLVRLERAKMFQPPAAGTRTFEAGDLPHRSRGRFSPCCTSSSRTPVPTIPVAPTTRAVPIQDTLRDASHRIWHEGCKSRTLSHSALLVLRCAFSASIQHAFLTRTPDNVDGPCR